MCTLSWRLLREVGGYPEQACWDAETLGCGMINREVSGLDMIQKQMLRFGGSRQERVLNGRPKLLFLAWPFAPLSISACVRTWNIAKYLARLGWEVTVVTPHPSVWRHVDSPEATDLQLRREGIRRILTRDRWRCLAPEFRKCWNQGLGWLIGGICRTIARRLDVDSGVGWIRAAEQACATLTRDDVDVLLATGKPFAAFKLAKRLSERLHRPYVLDYRDPWTGNPHRARPAGPATVREEARLLADCAGVTIVSPSWREAMERRFGLGPKLHVITNGYDPEALADVKPYDFGHCAIVYTGNFYPPKRVISPVLAALKHLKDTTQGKGGQWYFHYYGGQGHRVREEAERFGVTEQVVLHGNVPRAEALAAVKGAGVTVVITSVAEGATMADRGIMTGKVFEALGLGTPILLVAPPGSDVETIAETTGLARRFTGNDVAGIAAFLAETVSGRAIEPKNLDVYAWTNIARRLDAILREAAVSALCDQSR
jgi:glycosyltransferase involved in cell wall biosynthesis